VDSGHIGRVGRALSLFRRKEVYRVPCMDGARDARGIRLTTLRHFDAGSGRRPPYQMQAVRVLLTLNGGAIQTWTDVLK
jgi:hypothetical protein